MKKKPIGIFDSGFGGLTVLREIEKLLPQYDFLYLGDNARAPYGNRSFEIIHKYTLEAVKWLFRKNCHLVVIACNTASAKALRTIQQKDLPRIAKNRRVLGIIRPVSEIVGNVSPNSHIGILGTTGTVTSNSYVIEINKFFPDLSITQEACPMFVPIVENNEFDSRGADYFVQKHIGAILKNDPAIDTLVLGCTHYPLLIDKINQFLPPRVKLISQGTIVARSLADYLRRHPEINIECTKNKARDFFTSETAENFDRLAAIFYGSKVRSEHVEFA
jgi:glutamate racemase